MLSHLTDFLVYIFSEKGLSENTCNAYRRDIRSFYLFLNKRAYTDWNHVKKQDVIDFLSDKKKADYATSSISRSLIAIKVFFCFLKKEGVTSENIALYFETPKLWQVIPDVLTQYEMEKLLDLPDVNSMSGSRDRAIIELLYGTGIRVAELCQLKIHDVGDEDIRVKGKGGKERVVPIGTHAILAIDHYLTFRNDEEEKSSLFLTNRGKQIDRVAVWKMIKGYAKQAGIEKVISPHTFRHTCATDLLKNGADLRVIQEILGHADISSTERYMHVDCDQLKETFKAFHPHY